MSDIIMRYEDYLIHTKHASDNTVASYMRDLRQYASYLGSEGVDVLDADQAVVSGYMGSMKAGGKSAATISRALASIKSLYIFAIQIHEIEENPIQNIKIDKAEKKLLEITIKRSPDRSSSSTGTGKNNNCISPNCRHFPCRWIISRPHTPMVACMSPGVRASRKRSQ